MWTDDDSDTIRSRPARRHLRPHSLLSLVPIGCWWASIGTDLASRSAANPAFLVDVSTVLVEVGLFGAAVASVAGFADLRSVAFGTTTFRLAMWHAGAVLTVMILFMTGYVFRLAAPAGQPVGTLVVTLSVVAMAVLAIGGAVGAFLAHRRY